MSSRSSDVVNVDRCRQGAEILGVVNAVNTAVKCWRGRQMFSYVGGGRAKSRE